MLWFRHNATIIGENFEFCISLMPKNPHNANIFYLDFGHENFTLTFPAPPFKRSTPFCIEPPLLRIFFQSPFRFRAKIFQPPFKKGRGRELCTLWHSVQRGISFPSKLIHNLLGISSFVKTSIPQLWLRHGSIYQWSLNSKKWAVKLASAQWNK